jgi:hypothetical protein
MMEKLKHTSCRLRFKINLIVPLFFVLLGCEKEIVIEQLENAGGIVTMYSFVQPGKPFDLSISKSVSMLSSQSYDLLENGWCEVQKNGQNYQNMWFPNDTIWSSYSNLDFTYGDSVSIQLYVDNQKLVSASTIIPTFVEIEKVDTSRILKEDNQGVKRPYMKVNITFSDPISAEIDYYQLVLQSEVEQTINGTSNVTVEVIDYPKDDKVFNNTEQGSSSIGNIDFQGLFTDYAIEGQRYVLSTIVPIQYFLKQASVNSKSVNVLLYHLSSDYYTYTRSRIIADAYESLPIFEPVKIHSNIIGGFGVVGGLSNAADTLVIQ